MLNQAQSSQPSSSSPTTRWSLIVRAQGSGAERRSALGELLRYYEGFVISLLRRYRRPPDTILEELKQEFFEGMLRNDDVGKLDRARGSFHGFLNIAVRRFVMNEWSKWHAVKAGRRVTAPLEHELLGSEPPDPSIIDDACMGEFARDLVRHALALQRRETRDQRRFDALARFLPGPQIDLVEYAPLARSLDMTPNALAKSICLLRSRHGELMRLAIRDLNDLQGASERAVDDELRELRSYLFT